MLASNPGLAVWVAVSTRYEPQRGTVHGTSSIRLIRGRPTTERRGFAFVWFAAVPFCTEGYQRDLSRYLFVSVPVSHCVLSGTQPRWLAGSVPQSGRVWHLWYQWHGDGKQLALGGTEVFRCQGVALTSCGL